MLQSTAGHDVLMVVGNIKYAATGTRDPCPGNTMVVFTNGQDVLCVTNSVGSIYKLILAGQRLKYD